MDIKTPWRRQEVFYELYVDKFSGTFQGLSERMPYFVELGVDVLHFLPFYPSPVVDGGYDISDYQNVRTELGTLKDFEICAKRAKDAGIKLMVDIVLNHTSVRHSWFEEAAQNPKSEKRGYYLWSDSGKEFPDAILGFPHAKPKNWIFNPTAGAYYFSTFYPEQADLNWDNPEVFERVTEIMDFWVGLGAGAFRLDAVSHLVKREGTRCKNLLETHRCIKKIRAHTERHYPEIALVGEVHDTIERMQEYFGAGDECHFLYHFPLAEALIAEAVLGSGSLSSQYVQNISDVPAGSSWLAFLRNHDDISLETLPREYKEQLLRILDPEERFRFGNGVALRLKNVCEKSIQNADQCVREFYQTLFSLPVPVVLYSGEEIGMKNMPAVESNYDARAYVRGEFDWYEAERQREDAGSLFSFIKQRITARENVV